MNSSYKHKKSIEKYNGSLQELANDVGDLHYESLVEFLSLLEKKLYDDSLKDKKSGRVKLSNQLYQASSLIGISSFKIEKAWEISKPYMNEGENK
jgi:hypothetical protein